MDEEEAHGGGAQVGVGRAGRGVAGEELGEDALDGEEAQADGGCKGVGGLQEGFAGGGGEAQMAWSTDGLKWIIPQEGLTLCGPRNLPPFLDVQAWRHVACTSARAIVTQKARHLPTPGGPGRPGRPAHPGRRRGWPGP